MTNVHIDIKEAAGFFTECLTSPDKEPKTVNERIGKRAAEIFVEMLASQIAQSHIREALGKSIAVPTAEAIPPQPPGIPPI